ncbi:MAG: prolyl aminopeptidase [Candidatus Porifericomitaceae bacterium WSBS_2022_MAG_OTU9]
MDGSVDLFQERAADSCELDVGSGHKLYLEQSGADDGIPVLYLHGGPGSGAKPDNRRLFDPDVYRLVILDQRGSGRSSPHGHLQDNDTAHLIADLELVRRHYGIERWVVYGGSWGSTLALAYAQKHPERVLAMVLRSVFLARACDLRWHNEPNGASLIFPEARQKLSAAAPAEHSHDPISWLATVVLGADFSVEQKLAAALAWDDWASQVVTWRLPSLEQPPPLDDGQKKYALRRVGIEMHYFTNHYFLREDELLQEAHRIPNIPIHILHGRCDMTCTVSAAWDLHHSLPQSSLQVLADAGHLSSEPQMQQALLGTLAGLPQEL